MIEHLPEQAARPYGIVYLATNTANGKGYIGQTVRTLKARMDRHRWDANARRGKSWFHHAIAKYGFESFTWQVLAACDTGDDLNAAEQAFIATMKTKAPGGYNLTNGGYGHSGLRPSAETKQKISEAQIGNTYSKGKVVSVETRRKISEGQKGRHICAEHRRRISESLKGRAVSIEARQKMSESAKMRWKSIIL